MEIQYLGHAGFRISHKGTEIIIDPYLTDDSRRLTKPPVDPRELRPNFILITHEHFDHCDVPVVKMLARRFNAKVIGPPPVERKLDFKIVKVRPGNELDYGDFIVRVIPAFHHQSEFPVGFLLDFDGFRIYHAGDTYYDRTLADVNTDIAMVPIGGTYTMNVEEAAKLVKEMSPRVAIPMHYGTFEEIQADPAEFEKLVDNALILKPGEVVEFNQGGEEY
mgnify:CR=1 FL=1